MARTSFRFLYTDRFTKTRVKIIPDSLILRMQRSPERYLLYFILVGLLGSMMLIYGIAAWREQPSFSIGALAIAISLFIAGGVIFVQRKNKK